jgi:hypothetical protein
VKDLLTILQEAKGKEITEKNVFTGEILKNAFPRPETINFTENEKIKGYFDLILKFNPILSGEQKQIKEIFDNYIKASTNRGRIPGAVWDVKNFTKEMNGKQIDLSKNNFKLPNSGSYIRKQNPNFSDSKARTYIITLIQKTTKDIKSKTVNPRNLTAAFYDVFMSAISVIVTLLLVKQLKNSLESQIKQSGTESKKKTPGQEEISEATQPVTSKNKGTKGSPDNNKEPEQGYLHSELVLNLVNQIFDINNAVNFYKNLISGNAIQGEQGVGPLTKYLSTVFETIVECFLMNRGVILTEEYLRFYDVLEEKEYRSLEEMEYLTEAALTDYLARLRKTYEIIKEKIKASIRSKNLPDNTLKTIATSLLGKNEIKGDVNVGNTANFIKNINRSLPNVKAALINQANSYLANGNIDVNAFVTYLENLEKYYDDFIMTKLVEKTSAAFDIKKV